MFDKIRIENVRVDPFKFYTSTTVLLLNILICFNILLKQMKKIYFVNMKKKCLCQTII